MLARARGEGLVGPLQNSLRANVDPAAGGHLPVHRETERFEPVELVPGAPLGHEVAVGDQDARGVFVGFEHRLRAATLNQQRLITFKAL